MKTTHDTTRRRLLLAGVAATASMALPSISQADAGDPPLQTRRIPVSGEALPIIGIGTALIFDFENDDAKYADRRRVMQTLVAGGGKLIDTAHSYGRAEDRVGELTADLGLRERLFLATKFSFGNSREAAVISMQNSLRRLKTNRVDLMQAWNVADANYDLGLLREWKREGICRYTGMTISQARSYEAIGKVLTREKPDFFQVNNSLGDREAEERLLPAARDVGAAVLINLPFGRNSLFKKSAGKPLPAFAAEIGATSWAQLFLKFILSHPAVTAVIPGTDKPEYMQDNLQAGRGFMPDAALRRRIIDYWDAL